MSIAKNAAKLILKGNTYGKHRINRAKMAQETRRRPALRRQSTRHSESDAKWPNSLPEDRAHGPLQTPLIRGALAAFERQFGDAGFVQFAEAELNHAVVLFFCGCGQRQTQFLILRQF